MKLKNIKKAYLFDCFAIMLLFAFSFVMAIHYLHGDHKKSNFYQSVFSPAVSFACGKGYHAIDYLQSKPLEDFLTLKTNQFSCSDLPVINPNAKLSTLQIEGHYFLLATGIVWRLSSISWNNLFPLFALLMAISITACYGIFRLGLNPFTALIGIFLILASKLFLYYLPDLRDFSPAAFCLPFIFLLGLMVKIQFNKTNFFILTIFSAVILAIGLGFRPDLLVFAPLFPVVLFFFSSLSVKENLKFKTLLMIIFLLIFGTLSYPIFSGIHSGSNLFHVIIEGYADPFSVKLAVSNSPAYSFLYSYNDSLTYDLISSYGYRILGIHTLIPFSSELYDKVGFHVWISFLANFPADFITRLLASTWQVLLIPYNLIIHETNFPLHLINMIRYGTLMLAILYLLVLAQKNLRYAIFCAFLIIYLGAYPVLQFGLRHYFYLLFIPLFIALSVFEFIYSQYILRYQNNDGSYTLNVFPLGLKGTIKRSLFFIGIPSLMIFIFLSGVRIYQSIHLRNLFEGYLNAHAVTIPIQIVHLHNGNTLIKMPSKQYLAKTHLSSTYYKIVITPKFDGNKAITIKTVFGDYQSKQIHPLRILPNEFDSIINIPSAHKSTIFIPIYNDPYHHFIGIELPQSAVASIKSIQEIKTNENMPLILPLTLVNGWQKSSLYQTIGVSDSDIKV